MTRGRSFRENLFGGAVALLCCAVPVFAAEAPQEKIPYDVTKATGKLIFAIDPETAYEGLARGTPDVEPMNEVRAYALPPKLPPPIIVPAAEPAFYVQLNRLEKEGPKLTGEDLVFKTIREDQEKERCLIFGEGCSLLEIIEED